MHLRLRFLFVCMYLVIKWFLKSSHSSDMFLLWLKVLAALNVTVSAKCPAQIPTTESSNVIFFSDYEDGTPVSAPCFNKEHQTKKEYYMREYTVFSLSKFSGRGVRVTDSEAFCGRWSVRNPGIIFNYNDYTASGTYYNKIVLQTYNTVSNQFPFVHN